jgi:copper chaperone CopZ
MIGKCSSKIKQCLNKANSNSKVEVKNNNGKTIRQDDRVTKSQNIFKIKISRGSSHSGA